MQYLDIKNKVSILEHQIRLLREIPSIDDIVLGISEGADNNCYYDFANKNNIKFISGREENVLERLILCLDKAGGTDAFRITTESPFIYYEPIIDSWNYHQENNLDFSYLDNVPDGCGFEIIGVNALIQSHQKGLSKHKSELCSLYIRENLEKFRSHCIEVPDEIRRLDIRLTVDYPEDLIVCRAVYRNFNFLAPKIPVDRILKYLDLNSNLKKLVDPFIAEGLRTMI